MIAIIPLLLPVYLGKRFVIFFIISPLVREGCGRRGWGRSETLTTRLIKWKENIPFAINVIFNLSELTSIVFVNKNDK